MIVVSNTTPIISLSSIGRIDLIGKIFDKVVIPRAVYNEIKSKKHYGYEEVDKDFFVVKELSDRRYLDLLLLDVDLGEAEAILLSKELNADILLLDERMGIDLARFNNIFCVGTLTVLKIAKDMGLIEKIKPLLDNMIIKGRYYSRSVYNSFLAKIGEF